MSIFRTANKPAIESQTNNSGKFMFGGLAGNVVASNAYNAFSSALSSQLLAAQQANQTKTVKGHREKPDGDCITLFAVEGGDNVIPVYVPVGEVKVDNAYLSLPARLFRTREDAEQAVRSTVRNELNKCVMSALQSMTSAAIKQGLCEPVDLALLDALNAYAEACKP